MQEFSYEGETDVDELLGKVIKRIKSYNASFQLGVIIPHKDILV